MANLRSPSVVINEIELAIVEEGVTGTPTTVVGTSQRGRAFVPHTVGNQSQLLARFGDVLPETPGLHAAFRYLAAGTALTYIRVLGAGENAGFKVDQLGPDEVYAGDPSTTNYFLSAVHRTESDSLPGIAELDRILPTDYDSNGFVLVRGQIITAHGWSLRVDDVGSATPTPARNTTASMTTTGLVALTLISPMGSSTTYNVSLNPTNPNYFKRVLNTNPLQFGEKGHVLWREWPIDPAYAIAEPESGTHAVYLDAPVLDQLDAPTAAAAGLSESTQTINQALGNWGGIYRDALSPWVLSQPFAATPDAVSLAGEPVFSLSTRRLFRFHSIDDGTSASTQVKVSIQNLRASTSSVDPYGTFDVAVRRFNDTDASPEVIELFRNCNLNPESERYIARVIGDQDTFLDWNRVDAEDRRLVRRGSYANRSNWIWVEVAEKVEKRSIPVEALPFGYESVEIQRLNSTILGGSASPTIPPPVFRRKATRGQRSPAGPFGIPSKTERADSNLHWGIVWEAGSNKNQWNAPSNLINPGIASYCAYAGVSDLGQVVDGKEAGTALQGEFSLAYVTLSAANTAIAQSQSPNNLMRTAYYVRGSEIATIDSTNFTFTVNDGLSGQDRVSFATLLVENPGLFNRYTSFMKFTVPLQGGWDGSNPFWRESANFTDRASGVIDIDPADWTPGFGRNVLGQAEANIVVESLNKIAEYATDIELSASTVIATPGYREPLIVDRYLELTEENGFAIYIADVPSFDEAGQRIWTGSVRKPDIDNTIASWSSRNIDNSFGAAYFPDVLANLPNGRGVVVPASAAALSVIAVNDRDAYPWYAPAGFNRGQLPWVTGLTTKVRESDRDELYDTARINPIFSGTESEQAVFVVIGQRTLQLAESARDRINVRRAVIVAKTIARNAMLRNSIFNQADAQTRALVAQETSTGLDPLIRFAGARSIRVVCDDTNNSAEDVRNRLIRMSIVFVPVDFIENVIIDIVLDPTGRLTSTER